MSDCCLDNYKLSNLQKCLFPIYSVYSFRHFEKSGAVSTWQGKIVHVLTGLAELIPVIGAIFSLFELYIASSKKPKALEPKMTVVAKTQIPHPSPYSDSERPVKKSKAESSISRVAESLNQNNVDQSPKISHPTVAILKTKGFRPDARDAGHETRFHQTLSEVQGTLELCQKVCEVFPKSVNALGIKQLRQEEKNNPNLFRIFQFKNIGHIFSLEGTVNLPDKSKVNLEGFNEIFTIPMMAAALQESLEKIPIEKKTNEWILKVLQGAITKDNNTEEKLNAAYDQIQDPNNNTPVLLGSGWDWHATNVIFYKSYMIYCNRGAGNGGNSGFSVYKIPDKTLVTKSLLKQITSRFDYTETTYLSKDKLVVLLQAKLLKTQLMKAQKVGNCTYASLKAAFFALLFLKFVEESAIPIQAGSERKMDIKDLDPIEEIGSFANPRLQYKQFTKYLRESALEDFLIDIGNLSHHIFFDDNEELVKSIRTIASKIRDKLPKTKITVGVKIKAVRALAVV